MPQSSQIDVFDLFNHVYPDVTRFLDQLFSSNATWRADIHAEVYHTEQMRQFYFDAKNNQRTRGIQNFGIGFPYLIDNLETQPIVEPVFIWYTTLAPHPSRPDSWVMSFGELNTIVPNQQLIHLLNQKYQKDFQPTFDGFLAKKDFNLRSFDAFSRQLVEELGLSNPNITSGFKNVPTGDNLELLTKMGDLAWSAKVGIFEPFWAKNDTPPVANIQNQRIESNKVHRFTALETDDEQNEALRRSLENQLTLVEAAHGSGKTRTAINQILHALSNGQKMAVVANDMATLVEIQAKLVEMGLGSYAFLLKDLYHDKNILLQTLKNESQNKPILGQAFDVEGFRLDLNQARRWQSRLDAQQSALTKPIFGTHNWESMVGQYNRAQHQIGKELLANHLKSDDFLFTETEYQTLCDRIEAANQSFQHIKTLRHPLTALHTALFETASLEESKEFVAENLEDSLQQITKLQHSYIKTIEKYNQKLTDHYDSHFHDLSNHVQKLREEMADYIFQYGDDFENASGGWLAIASPFSNHASGILKAKQKLTDLYEKLKKAYNSREYRYFDHTFLRSSEAKDTKKLKQNLTNFDLSLQSCRMRLTSMVNEQVMRLNSKTAKHFDEKIAEKAIKIEAELEQILTQLNQTGLFHQPFTHKMLTLPKRLQYIEDVKSNLESTQTQLRDFEVFYNWQRMWTSLDTKTQKLLDALVRVNPSDWKTAFDSWYFYHILMFNYDVDIPRANERQNNAAEWGQKIRQALLPQISNAWTERKAQAMKALKTIDRSTFSWFFESKQKNADWQSDQSLIEILKDGLNPLTEFFPVLLMPPPVYRAVLGLKNADERVFNLSIFENAQNLDANLGNLTAQSERAVAFAERSVFDNPNTDNLVGWFRAQNAPTVRLKHIYKTSVAPLANFQNAVFYPDAVLDGESPAYLLDFLKIVNLENATFNEERQDNRHEIAPIMAVLEKLESNPTTRLFPKVGIVTFTRQQRNRIGAHLLQLVQRKATMADKIERLQNSGNLQVFDIEEMDGNRFDVLIVSGTFSDAEQALGIQSNHLRLILNAFSTQLVWVNSMSDMTLQFVADNEPYHSPLHLLASSILFLSNVSKQQMNSDMEGIDEAFMSNIQSLRADYWQPRPTEPTDFAQQLATKLVEVGGLLPEDVILGVNLLPNLTAPLAIRYFDAEKMEKWVGLRIDGRFGTNEFFNTDRELRILNQLVEKNIPILDVWTVDFWKKPNQSVQKLVEQLETLTQPPPPSIEPELVAEKQDV